MTARTKAKARPPATAAPAEAPAAAALARVSPAKIRANRTNASLSTGPRTAEGKRIARWNALRHGVLSAAVVLPDENEADFRALRDHLRADLQPLGAVEELLTDRIVSLAWRLRRLGRVEGEILRWAKAEAERVRWAVKSVTSWQDAKKRAEAEAEGKRQRIPEKGRRRRGLREGPFRRADPPVVARFDRIMAEADAARIALKSSQAEHEKDENWRGAMFELVVGAGSAAMQARFAEEYTDERDSDKTALGRGFMNDHTDKALDRVQRYETTLDRAIGRTLDRLLQLQAARGAGCVVLDAQAERDE